MLPSYNSKVIVSLQIVRQVAVLPSYNSKATVSSLCSLPIPIYSDLFEFIVNLFEFCRISEKKERMLTNACKALAKHWLSRDHPTSFSHSY